MEEYVYSVYEVFELLRHEVTVFNYLKAVEYKSYVSNES